MCALTRFYFSDTRDSQSVSAAVCPPNFTQVPAPETLLPKLSYLPLISQNFRHTPHPSEPLEFWCMLAPWIPTFPVRPDPPLLEVFAIGAAVLVCVTLVHGSVLGQIVL